MDLSTLTLNELRNLLAQIPKEIDRREKEEKASVRKEMEALAIARGFTLEQLLGDKPANLKEKNKAPVKYRHPENADLAWTGRGRQPLWVVAFIENGGTLEQLQV